MRDNINQSISGRQNENNQHKVFAIGFSLIALVIAWFLLKPFVSSWKNGQQGQDEQRANAEILKAPSALPEDVFNKIQNKSKIFLIDISSPDDFKRGHLATAVNAPAEKLDKNFLKNIGAESAADIVVMNQGSNLAILAETVNKVVASGFANAKYMRGGIPDWREKGFPLVSLSGSDSDNAKVKKITIDELKKDSETNAELLQFLDVRNKDLFVKEHIVGAQNISVDQLEMRKNEISPIKKVIVYGTDENESFQAAVTLFDLNFLNIYQMDGGIDDWKKAGGNVIIGN